jgi:hypothetical protein
MTSKMTFWKYYEILYKSFINLKTWFQSSPGWIKANTESVLSKQRATKTESKLWTAIAPKLYGQMPPKFNSN